jgi:hypothetical protein
VLDVLCAFIASTSRSEKMVSLSAGALVEYLVGKFGFEVEGLI